ncbi:hypothetical protein A4R44_06626 [Amycolatopsis sp. M39]|nr:hypothetical protein A4R44_06626 [Amycolatopsis sp. M39]
MWPPRYPADVRVQLSSCARHESAVDAHCRAAAGSPFARAIAPAVTSPATSAAIDDGDRPSCSSHRSVVAGPLVRMCSAVTLTRAYVAASVSPGHPSENERVGILVQLLAPAELPRRGPLDPAHRAVARKRAGRVRRPVALGGRGNPLRGPQEPRHPLRLRRVARREQSGPLLVLVPAPHAVVPVVEHVAVHDVARLRDPTSCPAQPASVHIGLHCRNQRNRIDSQEFDVPASLPGNRSRHRNIRCHARRIPPKPAMPTPQSWWRRTTPPSRSPSARSRPTLPGRPPSTDPRAGKPDTNETAYGKGESAARRR